MSSAAARPRPRCVAATASASATRSSRAARGTDRFPATASGSEVRGYVVCVPLSVQVGLLLALATAVASLFGFLLKHRGAVESPDVDWRHPLRSSLPLFRSRAYVAGFSVAMVSWGLHVGALA